MKECPKCGQKMSADAKFCSNCGQDVSDVSLNKDEQESIGYWRWIYRSWRYPMNSEGGAAPWYGIVTLLWEDALLFIGMAIAGSSFANAFFGIHLFGLFGAQVTNLVFDVIIILLLFQVVTILCSMVGHLFIFGTVKGFWHYVNRVTQASNCNTIVAVIAFICLLFTVNSGIISAGYNLFILFGSLFSLGSFVVALRGNPDDEPVMHDPFYGAVIYSAALAIAYALLFAFFRVIANF